MVILHRAVFYLQVPLQQIVIEGRLPPPSLMESPRMTSVLRPRAPPRSHRCCLPRCCRPSRSRRSPSPRCRFRPSRSTRPASARPGAARPVPPVAVPPWCCHRPCRYRRSPRCRRPRFPRWFRPGRRAVSAAERASHDAEHEPTKRRSSAMQEGPTKRHGDLQGKIRAWQNCQHGNPRPVAPTRARARCGVVSGVCPLLRRTTMQP